jgi:hypothetical protein
MILQTEKFILINKSSSVGRKWHVVVYNGLEDHLGVVVKTDKYVTYGHLEYYWIKLNCHFLLCMVCKGPGSYAQESGH